MKRFVVWNPEKLSWNANGLDLDFSEYESLLVMEKEQDSSWSSEIPTNDIKAVIAAVHNETDQVLCYQEITLN